MENHRVSLLNKLQICEDKMIVYSEITGPGFSRKIERFRLLGFRYLIFEFCHRLNVRLTTKVNLFCGLKITVPLHDLSVLYMYLFGALQDEELPVIKFLVKKLQEKDIFYDVGANYGFYASLAKSIAPGCEIHIFEPNPYLQSYLKKSLPIDIKVNELALSNRAGELYFYEGFTDGSSGTSSVNIKALEKRPEKYKKIKVNSITLDQYVHQTGSVPTFIKVDIEDGETDFLKGSIQTFSTHSPKLIIEIWNRSKGGKTIEALRDLLDIGYKLYAINNFGDLILVDCVDDLFDKNQDFINACLIKT